MEWAHKYLEAHLSYLFCLGVADDESLLLVLGAHSEEHEEVEYSP